MFISMCQFYYNVYLSVPVLLCGQRFEQQTQILLKKKKKWNLITDFHLFVLYCYNLFMIYIY